MNTTKILDFKQKKNTINRHYQEMNRLNNLVRRGMISKNEAIVMFQDYLDYTLGRKAKRKEYPYKQTA